MKRAHVFVSGKVQGVGFRRETQIRAAFLDLKGFIKNLEDGRVEAVVEGEPKSVDKLLKWMKRGPAFAHVVNICVSEERYKGEFKNFKIIF